jgi:prefoldin alpha subunit
MAEYQSVSVSNEREVSAEDLSLDQLANLKQQHEDEIKELSSQLDQLFGAKNRYINARNVLDDMNKTEEDSTLLIPLTSSLYAPGKIQNPKKVIVELGTGYFIEKTIPEAKDLISRKFFLLIYFFSPLFSISLCVCLRLYLSVCCLPASVSLSIYLLFSFCACLSSLHQVALIDKSMESVEKVGVGKKKSLEQINMLINYRIMMAQEMKKQAAAAGGGAVAAK